MFINPIRVSSIRPSVPPKSAVSMSKLRDKMADIFHARKQFLRGERQLKGAQLESMKSSDVKSAKLMKKATGAAGGRKKVRSFAFFLLLLKLYFQYIYLIGIAWSQWTSSHSTWTGFLCRV